VKRKRKSVPLRGARLPDRGGKLQRASRNKPTQARPEELPQKKEIWQVGTFGKGARGE